MKVGFLADDTDHGTRELREICKGKSILQLIGVGLINSCGPSGRPSLPPSPRERSEGPETPLHPWSIRKVKIPVQPPRTVDGLYQRCELILPLMSKTKRQGKYDQAMRDYKKGSFLNSSKSAQLIPGLPANTPAQQAQHKRVFDKVWSSVERIMSEMKVKLDKALKDHNRSAEEQEKTIE